MHSAVQFILKGLADTAISSSFLILSILFIRVTFRERIGAGVQYALWSAAALRLCLVPPLGAGLPESSFSILGGVMRFVSWTAAALPPLWTGRAALQNARGVFRTEGNGWYDAVKNGAGLASPSHPLLQGTGEFHTAATEGTGLILLAIYLAGIVLFLGWTAYVSKSFKAITAGNRRYIGTAEQLFNKQELANIFRGAGNAWSGLFGARPLGQMAVYLSGGLVTPCLLRWKGETAIYLSQSAAADPALGRYAVLHELCHALHRDLFWARLRCVLLALYWFHPFVWIAALMSKRDCELACDAAVIKIAGESERLAYSRALLELLAESAGKRQITGASEMAGHAVKEMKERVTMLAGEKKKSLIMLTAVLVIIIFAVSCAFTQPAASAGTGAANAQTAAASDMQMNEVEKKELLEFGKNWANAFSERDGKTLYEMCSSKELYLTVGEMGKQDNGEVYFNVGMSSPWPWYKEENIVEVNDDRSIDIYYFFRTSEPSVSVSKQTLTSEAAEDGRRVTEISYDDMLRTLKDFRRVYDRGLVAGAADAARYQEEIDHNYISDQFRKIICSPLLAAKLQLCVEADGELQYDKAEGTATVTFSWPDGTADVIMHQPVVQGENGAWAVKSILFLEN